MYFVTLAALACISSPAAGLCQHDPGVTVPIVTPATSAELSQLEQDFAEAMAAWDIHRDAELAKAKLAGTKLPKSARRAPTKAFIDRALEAAASREGKSEAIPFLSFVLANATRERTAIRSAVATLVESHAQDPAIRIVLPHLKSASRRGASRSVKALLNFVIESHTDRECRAEALLTRGRMRLERGDPAPGIADLKRVSELTEDKSLLRQAKQALADLKRFDIGSTAPEIEGVDIDGTPFRLSDYRGKVVLLDFWGFW